MAADVRRDGRDLGAVDAAFARARPGIVIHMAAQSLVRRSNDKPVETYATNVGGHGARGGHGAAPAVCARSTS